jgi:hypothetical protein
MRTFRIVGMGALAVSALIVLALFSHWREVTSQREGLKVLRELTPEKLIVSCGEPDSDKIDSDFMGNPVNRVLQYRVGGGPVELDFAHGNDKSWHLVFFNSWAVGTRPQAANGYDAIPMLPCLRNQEVPLWRIAKEQLFKKLPVL